MHGGAYFVCCKIEGGIALWYQLGIFDGKVVVVVFFSVIFAQKVGDVGRGGGGEVETRCWSPSTTALREIKLKQLRHTTFNKSSEARLHNFSNIDKFL